MANKKLNAIIQIGGGITGGLKGAFTSLKGNIKGIGGTIADLERKQKLLNQSISVFGKQGKNIDSLRSKYAENARQLDMLTASQERLNRAQEAGDENESRGSELKGKIMGTVAAAVSVSFPIKKAMDFESTMADIKKVVNPPDGADPNSFFKGLGNQILKLSTQIPYTAEELGSIMAAAGQAGIANKDLVTFTTTAAKMGVAFDISAEQAGQSLAEMRSAFNMTLPEVTTLADKINYLGNNSPAAAANIMDIVQRIGPLGGVANVASGEIAALGATMRGMGVPNEIASTGIKNLMLTLTAGTAATKAQKLTMKQLGYTSKQVARSMQLDSTKTMQVILGRIKQMKKTDQTPILMTLFGKDVAGSIAPLLQNLDQLDENFRRVAKGSAYAGSMNKEFEARASTTANSIVLWRNQLDRLSILIGSTILPQVNALVTATFPYLDQMAALIDQNPEVTRGIIAVGVGLVGLRIASLTAGFALNALSGYWNNGRIALAKFRAGITMARIAMTGFSISMLANPLVWIIGAIALAVGALSIAIYRNWDVVKSFISGAIQPLWENLKPVRESFSGLWEVIKHVGADFGITGENIQKAVTWFKDLFNPVKHGAEQLDKAGQAGATFGEALAGGIRVAMLPLTTLIDSLSWLDKNFNGIMEKVQTFGHKEIKEAFSSAKNWLFPNGGDEKATGAPGWNPSYLGGRTPPTIPAMAGGGGGGYTYSSNDTYAITLPPIPGETADAQARRVADEIQRRQQQKGRNQMTDRGAPR